MLGSSLLPKRFRLSDDLSNPAKPGWLNRQVTPILLSLSRRACAHPIHTIVFIALLASTTYVGLLEGSLFEGNNSAQSVSGGLDVSSLLDGSRNLHLGAETGWKWQTEDKIAATEESENSRRLALATVIFSDSLSSKTSQGAPLADYFHIPSNCTVEWLPSTPNVLAPISQDSSLVLSAPYDQISEVLGALQEVSAEAPGDDGREEKMWIMKAARSSGNNNRKTFQTWLQNAWVSFVDLVKHAETLDIVIMVLGYISMHLTFVSLFVAMKRLGSNFWLATSVLFSSVFAFLFGLIVTTKLGVSINMILLSEGLPFLVVTIGFEKSIVLTKAVLSASLDSRRPSPENPKNSNSKNGLGSPTSIQYAIQAAVNEKGFDIVRDYCIEIAILIAGAASGVQGGLRQFCFLAAWILVFDCLLLFTFYTTILCIKLEITRIKRHIALRKALEEDGVSHRVAENVASRNDWPKGDSDGDATPTAKNPEPAVFGRKVRASSVPKFKILMVSGFVLVNVLNLCTIPFRKSESRNAMLPKVPGLSNALTLTPIDPFRVAEKGLDTIYVSAKADKVETIVTVLPPIKYELEYPSTYYAESDDNGGIFDIEYTNNLLDVMGGRVIESLLKSFEDPVLSKWILIALTMSLILNGYLFNAARWSIKDPQTGPSVVEVKEPQPPPARTVAALAPAPPLNGAAHEPPSSIVQDRSVGDQSPRTRLECEQMLKNKQAPKLTDEELIDLSLRGKIPGYALEKTMEDPTVMTRLASFTRAVKIRRAVTSRSPVTSATTSLLESSKLPYQDFNYTLVHGACCENVIGYLPLPLGVAGPITIDGQSYFLPMATTEGVLVASASRGAKAVNAGGGVTTVLTGDGMTRGPCISFPTVARAGTAKIWLDSPEGQKVMTKAFNSTSRFARLQSMKTALAGTYLYIRFKTTTGDAMGMNMISKGVEYALEVMSTESGFDDMQIISLSGNYCTDKKAAAINWIDGRGKAVVAEAMIPGEVVRGVLKSDVNALVELNTGKNFVGSAMAGSIGGFNAHAANIVAAIFIATGQDPAQVVESANCITIMKNVNGNLHVSVSMPSIEVGTIGGGTILEAQSAMLDFLGVRGAHPTNPGDNARQLARIIGAGVLAGELSLCSALAAGHLVKAHMTHNRSAAPTRSTTPVSAAVAPFIKAQGMSEGLTMTSSK